ncbi:MAG: hypothetical protein ACT4PT_07385 [Methanobacteriota archaeon]
MASVQVAPEVNVTVPEFVEQDGRKAIRIRANVTMPAYGLAAEAVRIWVGNVTTSTTRFSANVTNVSGELVRFWTTDNLLDGGLWRNVSVEARFGNASRLLASEFFVPVTLTGQGHPYSNLTRYRTYGSVNGSDSERYRIQHPAGCGSEMTVTVTSLENVDVDLEVFDGDLTNPVATGVTDPHSATSNATSETITVDDLLPGEVYTARVWSKNGDNSAYEVTYTKLDCASPPARSKEFARHDGQAFISV